MERDDKESVAANGSDDVVSELLGDASERRRESPVKTSTLTFAELPTEDPRDKKFRSCTLKSRIAVFR